MTIKGKLKNMTLSVKTLKIFQNVKTVSKKNELKLIGATPKTCMLKYYNGAHI